MRLFAAVWPPDDVLDHLDLALAGVRRRAAGTDETVRWSARETWHLTAAFYGDLADASLDPLGAELAELAARTAPFSLALRGAGLFAHRTLWVGIGGDTAAMSSLAHAARDVGADHGAGEDPRVRNRPHLTVGRVRPGGRPARRTAGPRGARGPAGRTGADRGRGDALDPADALVQALAVYEGPAWWVDAVVLVESRPGAGRGGGPLYTPVTRYPLGAA
ncbi:RNA 2',3'-cyclic phosphodiesterase [Cellulomonas oligotrophica]|uniref:RNA 2',3'-cyclic phosphodiesterase n=1 Tax=Cellulomonas oligotrophica TaxID=931536 RepID=A0A7Y9JXW3_9CELL|nr:RNA 2',3'-cyclic phosphodiesterase [Cellulomonas oligotrophica]NYD84485.1 2'-5' RNA ligase [Cellulomonas oligotrophica]GIG33873.1 RNA 2',3'-cyclic phosphodiesterase [Cellulomonas oligotrophica]